MAITHTSAATAVDADAEPSASPDAPYAGLATLFGTGDHKVIGRLFIGFSLLLGVMSLAFAGLAALGQKSNVTFPKADWVLQLSTLSRVGMAFFFLIPLLLGIAIYVCPLQVGAATIAFPRAVAAGFWTWLVATAMAVLAWMENGGPGGGDDKMVDLSYFATGVAIVALLIVAFAVATTVITFRTPGMTLDRVPFFSWSMVVAAAVWGLTLPVLLAQFVLIYVDHHYGVRADFGNPNKQWTIIGWAFAAPQAFAYAIPALGIAADSITTLARARQPQRGVVLGSIGAFGALSIGAWAQPAFYAKVFDNWMFVIWSVVIALPILMFLGGVGGALRKGRVSPASPLVAGVLGPAGLLVGAIGAGLFAIGPLGLHRAAADYPIAVQDLYATAWYQPPAQIGVYGIVIMAATVTALGGLGYWGQKITGRRLGDAAGKAAVPLVFLGAVLYGLPLIALGFSGKAAGLGEPATVDTLSYISLVGAGLGALGLLTMAVALLTSAAGKTAADDDPWGVGQTLEWATSSPPARGNFGVLPVVTSAEPLLDAGAEGAP